MTHMEKQKAIHRAIQDFEEIFDVIYDSRTLARKKLLEMKAHDPEGFSASQYVLQRVLFYFEFWPVGGGRYPACGDARTVYLEMYTRHMVGLAYLGISETGRILDRSEAGNLDKISKVLLRHDTSGEFPGYYYAMSDLSKSYVPYYFRKCVWRCWGREKLKEVIRVLDAIGKGRFYEEARKMLKERAFLLQNIDENGVVNYKFMEMLKETGRITYYIGRLSEYYVQCVRARRFLKDLQNIDASGIDHRPKGEVYHEIEKNPLVYNEFPTFGPGFVDREKLREEIDRWKAKDQVEKSREYREDKKREAAERSRRLGYGEKVYTTYENPTPPPVKEKKPAYTRENFHTDLEKYLEYHKIDRDIVNQHTVQNPAFVDEAARRKFLSYVKNINGREVEYRWNQIDEASAIGLLLSLHDIIHLIYLDDTDRKDFPTNREAKALSSAIVSEFMGSSELSDMPFTRSGFIAFMCTAQYKPRVCTGDILLDQHIVFHAAKAYMSVIITRLLKWRDGVRT